MTNDNTVAVHPYGAEDDNLKADPRWTGTNREAEDNIRHLRGLVSKAAGSRRISLRVEEVHALAAILQDPALAGDEVYEALRGKVANLQHDVFAAEAAVHEAARDNMTGVDIRDGVQVYTCSQCWSQYRVTEYHGC